MDIEVVAKFKVDKVSETVSGSEVTLSPVTGGSKENESFFKWTPYGSIVMGTINPAVASAFKPGDEFEVTFKKRIVEAVTNG